MCTTPSILQEAVSLIRPLMQVCHERGVALIVDEAHGAHLGLHPAFPLSAMQSGADFAIQSTHKTLCGLTQSAMLHVHSHAPPRAAAALPRFDYRTFSPCEGTLRISGQVR